MSMGKVIVRRNFPTMPKQDHQLALSNYPHQPESNHPSVLREGVKKTVFFGTLSQTSDPNHPLRTFEAPLSEK